MSNDVYIFANERSNTYYAINNYTSNLAQHGNKSHITNQCGSLDLEQSTV